MESLRLILECRNTLNLNAILMLCSQFKPDISLVQAHFCVWWIMMLGGCYTWGIRSGSSACLSTQKKPFPHYCTDTPHACPVLFQCNSSTFFLGVWNLKCVLLDTGYLLEFAGMHYESWLEWRLIGSIAASAWYNFLLLLNVFTHTSPATGGCSFYWI